MLPRAFSLFLGALGVHIVATTKSRARITGADPRAFPRVRADVKWLFVICANGNRANRELPVS